MISRSSAVSSLVAVLILAINVSLVYALITAAPRIAPNSTEYPYTVIEVGDGAEEAADLLESRGFVPVLWSGSVTLPLSRVDSIEEIPMASLGNRLDTGDLRLNPLFEELRSRFDAPIGQGELLFVPGNPDEIATVMESSSVTHFIHRDRNLPLYAGLMLWVISTAALLIVLDNRRWTAIIALIILPLYFIRMPLYLALLSILFIVLRETGIAAERGYRNDINSDDSAGNFPGTPGDLLLFVLRRIRMDAPLRSAWALVNIAILGAISLVPGYISGMLALAVPLLFIPAVSAALYHQHKFSQDQEHQLFVARGITPSWDKPARNERAVLIAIILFSLALPFMFQVNASPFPTRFISAAPLDTGVEQGAPDFADYLGDRVISVLDARMEMDPPATESEGEAMAVILLADYAYQEAFPYVSLGASEGAGRYEDGAVYLSRFERSDEGLVAFEELVFQIDADWVESLLTRIGPYSMLRLYSHRERWYDVRPESGVLVVPQLWNLVPEILTLLILAFPWLGRWQFAPIYWIATRVRKRRNKQ